MKTIAKEVRTNHVCQAFYMYNLREVGVECE